MESNGNKVEEYIKTRSGAQIRSHAQKYFLKIQKEYPDQDPYEVFKCKAPEVLEETIFMKNKGDSEDGAGSHSQEFRHSHPPTSHCDDNQEDDKEMEEVKNEDSAIFSNSVK